MKLSLAITTYNRYDLTIKSFEQVLGDPRISEVVLLDDCSTDGSFEKLQEHYSGALKVKLIRQVVNRGMQLNKMHAISYCSNDNAILFDSDNIISTSYLDALEWVHFSEDTILCPDFARPLFSFKKFSGQTFDKSNIKELVADDMGNCSMNCCNYVVPVKQYLSIFKHNPEHIATDTIHFNSLWLEAGYKFHFVKDMEYDHLTGPQSGFMKDVHYNMAQSSAMRKKLMEL